MRAVLVFLFCVATSKIHDDAEDPPSGLESKEGVVIENSNSSLADAKGVWHVKNEHLKSRRKPREVASFAFYTLLAIIILFQWMLHKWKKKHNRSYLIVTLAGLLFFPSYVAWKLSYYRMLSLLAAFVCSSTYLVFLARQVPLDGETPRKIYSWFYGVYRTCNALALTGYFFVVGECMGFGIVFQVDFMTFGLTLLFYGLFYGLLGRDSCEICCDLMVNTMGYTTRGGLPLRNAQPGTCALCTKRLGPSKFEPEKEPESQIKLDCGHVFHESCIKGWVMVGKKDTCPVCREKVDLSILPSNPWHYQDRMWVQVLDALRYLIVWNPVMILAANFVFQTTGIPIAK